MNREAVIRKLKEWFDNQSVEITPELLAGAYAALCAQPSEKPEALTLEELREMTGEPVYLQFGDGIEGWAIVLIDGDCICFSCPNFDGYCEPDTDFYNMECNDPDGHFGLHILGWRALRSKLENEAIVHCAECEHYTPSPMGGNGCLIRFNGRTEIIPRNPTDFCSHGVRKPERSEG